MKRGLAAILFLFGALLAANAADAQRAEKPLFAESSTLRLTLRGNFRGLIRNAPRSEAAVPGALALAGATPESHAVTIAPRGLSRRRRDVCTFPPLRITFGQPPGAASLFRGPRRLRLVTHCRAAESFSNFTLLEYAAYRLANVVVPQSSRVRLVMVDYVEDGEQRPFASRLGFLIEDGDDAARRNGLTEIEGPARIRIAQLSPREAGRAAVLQYMLGNLDWAMNAGPEGSSCCHNVRLFGPARATENLIAVPYDFDYSGLVNAPYAVVPEQVPVSSVRVRRYRGFCAHNDAAQAAAAEFRAARPALLAALAEVPELDARPRASAAAYLEGFFRDIATPAAVQENLLRTCL